jgi:hypothetical protein
MFGRPNDHGHVAVVDGGAGSPEGGLPRERLRLVTDSVTSRDTPAEIVGSSTFATRPPRPGSPETWDEMVRHTLAAERARESLRDTFEAEYRQWHPGAIVDLAVLNDRAALAMIRRFLRMAKRAAVTPPNTAYRVGSQVVKHPPRGVARKVRCWEIPTPYSWVLLLPNGQLALQAHPDEFARIVVDDGREPVVVAGVNAPGTYSLSVDDVAAFILDACRLAGLDW